MSEWISTEDRLPKKHPHRNEYLLLAKSNGVVLEGVFNSLIGEFFNRDLSELNHKVTHWQPLPGPPK